jgi:hypothetical protein
MLPTNEAVNSNKMRHVFDFYSTACHGWVFVPWSVLHALSIDVTQFTSSSNADDRGVYLEEDCDFPLFDRLFFEATNQRAVLHDIHDVEGEVSLKTSIKTYLKKEGNK